VTSQDRGRLRAARTDREQAIELLKAAFVQGRLTKDEFVAVPRRKPGRAPKQATALSTGLVAAAVLLMSAVLIGNTQLTYLAVTVVCGAAFVTVAQILHSRHEQRLSQALPPRSAPAGRSLRC